jgi:HEAT repeat protein
MVVTGYPGPTLAWAEIPPDVPSALTKEIEGLRSFDAGDRARAAVKIGGMGAEGAPAVPFLVMLLADSTVLESHRNPEGSTSPGQEAALALVKIGSLSVDPLLGALDHENATVRRRAARALGKIKDPRAIRTLIDTLRDDDPHVRSHAAAALAEITGEGYGDDAIAWQNWLDRQELKHCLLLKLYIEMLRSSRHH